MAKKFVRGITDIKNIEHQDFDTNNVNDLLSDGKHNYIHRKKNDGTEEYHNLTNNLKTLEAVDNGLLTVRNFNNSTNSAKLTVHHDQAKSQLLASPDQTINVENGENGTGELTTVDVNPAKVLQHNNLLTNYGISKNTSGNNTTLSLEYTKVPDNFDLNALNNGRVRGFNNTNAPITNQWFFVSSFSEGQYTIQEATSLLDNHNVTYRRIKDSNVWGNWREQVGDKSVIDGLLSQKQNTLTSNTSIGVSGTGLQQLYTQSQTYTHTNATLKTHVKSIANSSSVSTVEEEFNFLAKMNKGATSATFTLSEHDTTAFESIIDSYGENGSLNISSCAFSINGSTLTFMCNQSTTNYNPYLLTFSDIIPATVSTQTAPSRLETE